MLKKNTDFYLTEMTIHISRQESNLKMGVWSLQVTPIIPFSGVSSSHGQETGS